MRRGAITMENSDIFRGINTNLCLIRFSIRVFRHFVSMRYESSESIVGPPRISILCRCLPDIGRTIATRFVISVGSKLFVYLKVCRDLPTGRNVKKSM